MSDHTSENTPPQDVDAARRELARLLGELLAWYWLRGREQGQPEEGIGG